KKRISPWRDTHIRLQGRAVWDLQNVFFNDWRCSKKLKLDAQSLVKDGYFNQELLKSDGNIGTHIITSGPESSQRHILDSYIKLMSLAKKRIYIQTPYFIPDELFFKTVVIAKRSGVDVKIMIPSKPDKKSVYYATLSYVKQLLDYGIEVFLYNGFIHSKTFLVDDLAVSIGTCNIDNRSFALNFEITTLLYNQEFVNKNKQIFENDIKNSQKLSVLYFKRKFVSTKIMQAIFRLFSQLM
ncbi:MAG: cardiolipin synthase, partial [Clostridia bacterium]|nr:cardiolipin synthase [Clostridia bacterium]